MPRWPRIHLQSEGIAAAMIIAAAMSVGCRNTTRNPAAVGTAHAAQIAWATPLSQPGLPNLHQVSTGLYRGAQPTRDGWTQLQHMGIETVVSLRGDDRTIEALRGSSIRVEHIPMSHWTVDDADVIRFLAIATDASRMPVFVHCEHGADRTGLLCAMYRVVVQGWSKDDAIAEMTRGGMGFHVLCGNLAQYVRNADVPQFRGAVGLDADPARVALDHTSH